MNSINDMRILHLSSAKSWRGGENQIHLLVKGLNKIGVQNFVAAPSNSPLLSIIEETDCRTLGYHKFASWNPFFSLRLKNYVENHQINLLHVHDSHAHNYAITAANLGMKTPIILSRKVDFPPNSKNKYLHPQIKKIICVSHAVKNVLASTIGPLDKMVVVYDGIETDIEPQQSLHQYLSLPPKTTLVINLAAIADHKDHLTFVKTADYYLNHYNNNVRFIIIGQDAGQKQEIHNAIYQCGRQKEIILTGYLDNAKQYLQSASAFLYTSKEEGLGSTLLDAMHYGIPIIATKAGGIKEIISHGDNGLLSPVGDYQSLAKNLDRVLTDVHTSQSLVRKAKKIAIKHGYDNFARQTLVHYQDILKQNP